MLIQVVAVILNFLERETFGLARPSVVAVMMPKAEPRQIIELVVRAFSVEMSNLSPPHGISAL
jgi:hypothetical protein